MNLQHIPQIDNHTLDRLKAYDWPGNVRELQNIVERALILSRRGRLVFPNLDTTSRLAASQVPIQPQTDILTMDQAMALHIRRALEATKGKISGKGGAAELLQINESTLRFRMKKLGIQR